MTSADAPLSVTVIGCSGGYSSGESSCSSYLVQSPTTSVLLDAGPGSSIELQRHLQLENLDAIVLSHEHPDHWTELPSLYHAFKYFLFTSVPVFGTEGTHRLLDGLIPDATSTAFEWTDINPSSEVTIGDLDFTFSLTDHPVETLAIRVQHGERALVYSADTGPGWSPEEFDAPIDVMIYEASLTVDFEGQDIPHVSGREAGLRAAAAGVGQLVLTHVNPGGDPEARRHEAEQVFPGAIHLAYPGFTIPVSLTHH
jgi:ribonuclease BN (tRNA processing enzyme)